MYSDWLWVILYDICETVDLYTYSLIGETGEMCKEYITKLEPSVFNDWTIEISRLHENFKSVSIIYRTSVTALPYYICILM